MEQTLDKIHTNSLELVILFWSYQGREVYTCNMRHILIWLGLNFCHTRGKIWMRSSLLKDSPYLHVSYSSNTGISNEVLKRLHFKISFKLVPWAQVPKAAPWDCTCVLRPSYTEYFFCAATQFYLPSVPQPTIKCFEFSKHLQKYGLIVQIGSCQRGFWNINQVDTYVLSQNYVRTTEVRTYHTKCRPVPASNVVGK